MADEEGVVDDVEDVVDESESSLSDDLEAAWEASEEPGADNESGGKDLAGEPDPGAGDTASGERREEQPAPGEAEGGKPPLDWSPELREEWGGLSAGVKTQIAHREAQMAQAMQGTAQARQIANDFGNIGQKYGSVMAAEGFTNPMQAVDTMLQTVTELRMGSPAQKASRIAELIQNYGIDIKTLDDSLAAQLGGQPAPAQQQMDPNMMHMIDQRMQPVNQMMQQLAGMQQQKQQQGNMAAQQEVQAFAQNAEFLDDVRHDVADLIDLATKHGREMPLQEAYDKACAMNPQISNVLAQRAQQQSLATAGQNVASKKMAASSLAPGNRGANTSPVPDTILGQLNAAWDEQIG